MGTTDTSADKRSIGIDAEYAPPIIAGNVSDDDAEYVADLVEPYAEPPSARELPTEYPTLPNAVIRTPNRLITMMNTYTGGLMGAMMLLPADPHRIRLRLTSDATANIYLAGDKPALDSPNRSAAFKIPPTALPLYFDLDGYTGAVWIRVDPTIPDATAWSYSLLAVTNS